MSKVPILALAAVLLVAGGVVESAPAPLPAHASGVCYFKLGTLSEEAYQRLLQAPEVTYLMCQEAVGSTLDPLTVQRARELTAAGKKIVLQLWYGPSGRYNWSYHSYPALALDSEAQRDFFAGVDKTLRSLGPENVYAVHLLEEDGWFGANVDGPGDWRLDKEGLAPGNSWDDGNCYSNYQYARKRGHNPWSEWTPSVRRFADVFLQDTGLDMRLSAAPLLFDYHVLDRWMGRRLWAGCKIALAKHMQAEYPHVRNFVWGCVAWSAEPFQADGPALREHISGAVQDPYGTPHHNYVALRAMLSHLRDPENVCLMWGTTDRKFKESRLTSAYVTGAHALGFYEDKGGPSPESPDRWEMNLELFRKFNSLPVFRAQRRVYYAFGNDANGPITGFNELPLFTFPEVSTAKECYDCEIEKYDIIVLHQISLCDQQEYQRKYRLPGPGLDRERVKAWVRDGGVLGLLQSGPDFLLEEGFIVRNPEPAGMTEAAEIPTPPAAQQALGMLPSYRLQVPTLGRFVGADRPEVINLPVGVLVRYGKGAIYCEPEPPASSRDAVKLMPPYHADVLRGALAMVGKKDLAAEVILPRDQISTPYYHARSEDGRVEVWLQYDTPQDTGVLTRGVDILTGQPDRPLDTNHPAIIVRH
ncbi:MAG: hypothetical protein GX100_13565 [candidate division WS1 bacterium]|nr:hypothetical protein [candidate division WS1 bacterium]